MRWVILDLGELLCLIDVSKLNPGPSGEDADAVGQPRDVGSPCASALGLVATSGLYLNSPDKNRSTPLARMQRTECLKRGFACPSHLI
jgi:hypothetical protein